MAHFTIRLPDDLAARFDAAAASAGGRSQALRRLIEGAINGAGEGTSQAPETTERAPGQRVTIRLQPAELADLDGAAEAAGLRRTQWIVGLIRRRLRGRPTLNRRDELAFIGVQSDLRRLGVNLNQIARAINTAVMPGVVLETELGELERFRLEIRAHLADLREAFQGNLDYWEAEA